MLAWEQCLDTLAPETTSATCTTTTSRLTPRVRPDGSDRPSDARSVTALAERALPPVLPTRDEFRTRFVRCRKHSAPMAPLRWARYARRRWHCSTLACCRVHRSLVLRWASSPTRWTVRPAMWHHRHPRRRGRVRRHGLQGRRHLGLHHRAAAGYQAGRGSPPRCWEMRQQAKDARTRCST